MELKDIVIAGAVRTPIGRFGGSLKGFQVYDLGSRAMAGLLEKTGIDPAIIGGQADRCSGAESAHGKTTYQKEWNPIFCRSVARAFETQRTRRATKAPRSTAILTRALSDHEGSSNPAMSQQ